MDNNINNSSIGGGYKRIAPKETPNEQPKEESAVKDKKADSQWNPFANFMKVDVEELGIVNSKDAMIQSDNPTLGQRLNVYM